jgi:hypothetical protein
MMSQKWFYIPAASRDGRAIVFTNFDAANACNAKYDFRMDYGDGGYGRGDRLVGRLSASMPKEQGEHYCVPAYLDRAIQIPGVRVVAPPSSRSLKPNSSGLSGAVRQN